MFNNFNRNKKSQVWISINVPFENASAQWEELKDDKPPMTEWSSFFNHLGVSKGTVENFQNALKRASSKPEEIINFGVVSPKKHSHSEVATLASNNLLLKDMFKEAAEGVNINVECLKVMDGFSKWLRVQEDFNSTQSILDRTQEMAEV